MGIFLNNFDNFLACSEKINVVVCIHQSRGKLRFVISMWYALWHCRYKWLCTIHSSGDTGGDIHNHFVHSLASLYFQIQQPVWLRVGQYPISTTVPSAKNRIGHVRRKKNPSFIPSLHTNQCGLHVFSDVTSTLKLWNSCTFKNHFCCKFGTVDSTDIAAKLNTAHLYLYTPL